MPPEWAPHHGTWLTWPCDRGDSFRGRRGQVFEVYRKLVSKLIETERVFINVWDRAMEEEARTALRIGSSKGYETEFAKGYENEFENEFEKGCENESAKLISFHLHPAYEPWCRDHGPIFVINKYNGERAIVDWDYNAWGERYLPFDLDNLIPSKIAAQRGLRLFSPKMILEGGSIDVNGRGVLMSTESCLLNSNRNPALSKTEIEARLMQYLGAEKVLWLGEGISGNDTDGHIDEVARFVNESTIVAALEEDPSDENYAPLQDNWKRLCAFSRRSSSPFRIIPLPMPRPFFQEGIRLPASYTNFYIANGQVIIPTFNDPNDQNALDILRNLFPRRRIIGIDSTKLLWGLGSFHCLTQQEPRSANITNDLTAKQEALEKTSDS